MALAVGRVEYTLGAASVTGCGLSWTAEELEAALVGPIAEVVFDDVGTADCTALIESVLGTEFDPFAVKRILDDVSTLFRTQNPIGFQSLLIGQGREIAMRGMTALMVIEHCDVFKHSCLGVCVRVTPLQIHQLGL